MGKSRSLYQPNLEEIEGMHLNLLLEIMLPGVEDRAYKRQFCMSHFIKFGKLKGQSVHLMREGNERVLNEAATGLEVRRGV